MAKKHDDYAAAYDALTRAAEQLNEAMRHDHPGIEQAQHGRQVAEEALRAAEAPLQTEIATAWDQNRRQVADAKQALLDAARSQASIEVACGNAARQRFAQSGRQGMPLLTNEEIAQINAARAVTDAARQAHDAAKDRFKAGVTVDQITEA